MDINSRYILDNMLSNDGYSNMLSGFNNLKIESEYLSKEELEVLRRRIDILSEELQSIIKEIDFRLVLTE